MAQSEIQSKVPFLGDLPFLGPLFQSSGSNTARDNLYVFLSAHIMDDANYNGLGNFTKDAIEGVRSFDDDIRLQQFTDPDNARDASQQDQITVEGASEEEMTP